MDKTPTQSENQLQAYCTELVTDPAAVTSATVVALGLASGPGSTTITPATKAGATSLTVGSVTSFFVGEQALIDGSKATAEIVVISATATGVLTLASPTIRDHAATATIVGMYAGIQPQMTGRIKITIHGIFVAGSTASTVTAQIYIGSAITVAAPANAAAFDASAVAVGNTAEWISLTGQLQEAFTLVVYLGANASATDTGPSGGAARTVATPYYIDIGITSSTGTIQVIEPSIIIEEL